MADKVGSVYIEIQAKMGSLEKDLKQLEARLQGVDGKAQQTSSSLMSMGKLIAGASITGAVIGLGKAALEASAKMEQNRVAFTTMLGSADKANKLLQEMTAFAANTPFQLPEIVNAGKQLLAFGVEADKIIPTLTQLGDVSAALNIPLGEMADIYGKNMVSGLIQAEDLNQMAGRGIPIFTELAKVMGVNADQVKKLGSEGKITFKELEQAFTNMTKEGSQFGGLMEAQSKTLAGQWSNFNDSIDKTLILLGDSASGTAKELLKTMSLLVTAANEYLEATAAMNKEGERLPSFLEVTNAWLDGSISKNNEIKSLTTAQNKSFDLIKQSLAGNVNLSEQEVRWLKIGVEERAKQLALLEDTSFINTKQNDIEMARVNKDIEANKKLKDAKSSSGSGKNKEDEANKKAYESRLVWLEKEAAMVEEFGSVEMAEFITMLEGKAQAFQQYTGVLTNMSGQLAQLSQMNAQNQTAEVDNRLNKELDAINERYETEKALIEESLLTEEEKNAKLKALDESRARDEKAAKDKAEKEKRKIAREAAKMQKQLAIFDTLVSIPTAAFQAYKSAQVLPFPASQIVGAAMAAAATGLGLAKLKLIKDQPLPALAEGGIVPAVPGGNQFTIGEAGSAEAVIPLNNQGIDVLRQALGGTGSQQMNITLQVDGETFGNWMYKATKNGQATISRNGVVA